MIPQAGSAYAYSYATLGEIVAWIIGWDLILEYGISVAPVAASWSGYVQSFLGNFGLGVPEWAKVAHLAIAGLDSHRAYQDEAGETMGATHRDLGRDPSAQRKAREHHVAQIELLEQIESGVSSGGELLIGGTTGDNGKGYFLEPAVVAEPSDESRLMREEVFGPVLPVFRFSDFDDAIARANDTPYGLGSSIWTHDVRKIHRAANGIEAGMTWVNQIHYGYDELPFGGVKASGIGREHGPEALDYYLEPKGVVITHGNVLANIAPLEREMRAYLKYERFVHPVRFLNLLPLSHVFGQFLGMFLPPILGGTVIFQEELNPSEVVRTIQRERVSVLVSVPRVLQSLKQKVERDLDDQGKRKHFQQRFVAAEGKHFLRRWWMFRDIHRQFGWKFWAFISGGAALGPGCSTESGREHAGRPRDWRDPSPRPCAAMGLRRRRLEDRKTAALARPRLGPTDRAPAAPARRRLPARIHQPYR